MRGWPTVRSCAWRRSTRRNAPCSQDRRSRSPTIPRASRWSRDGVGVNWAIPYRQRLPLGIAALAFAFLGLFLLYPLAQVFSASFLDSEGTALTFANYTKMLGRPFYRTAIL